MPAFSVIMPTHDCPDSLTAAVRSVFRQTEPDWELLVVVDGDTGGRADRLRRAWPDPRVVVLANPQRRGPGHARRTGCAAAQGDLIAYLDHDDEWTTDHLETAATRLATGAGLVATGATYLEDTGVMRRTRPIHLAWHHELLLLNPLAEPSRVVHTAQAYADAGPWPDLPGGFEDWALWLRMSYAGIAVAVTARRTVLARLSPSSRRHRLRAPFALPLAGFGGITAEQAWSRLTTPELARACERANGEDARSWLTDLDRRGELALPDGMSLRDALRAGDDSTQGGDEEPAGFIPSPWTTTEPARELAIVPGPGLSRLAVRTGLPDRRWLPAAARIMRNRRRRWRRTILDALTDAGARLGPA